MVLKNKICTRILISLNKIIDYWAVSAPLAQWLTHYPLTSAIRDSNTDCNKIVHLPLFQMQKFPVISVKKGNVYKCLFLNLYCDVCTVFRAEEQVPNYNAVQIQHPFKYIPRHVCYLSYEIWQVINSTGSFYCLWRWNILHRQKR